MLMIHSWYSLTTLWSHLSRRTTQDLESVSVPWYDTCGCRLIAVLGQPSKEMP
jgi:hypothetical protein